MASVYPKKFAALAPVCGGIRPPGAVRLPAGTVDLNDPDPYSTVAKKIGKTPVWVFHGADDPVVPVSESRKMVEALKAINGRVRYSEYAGVRHDSWIQAYGEKDLLPWLLSHKR
jgi:predicted peptidase